jgi:hypothetical protein
LSLAVTSSDGLKVLEDVMLRKNTELDLVAGYIEKGWIGLEDLAKDGMGEMWEPGTRDVDEGKGCREEGYRHVHDRGDGGLGERDGWDSQVESRGA